MNNLALWNTYHKIQRYLLVLLQKTEKKSACSTNPENIARSLEYTWTLNEDRTMNCSIYPKLWEYVLHIVFKIRKEATSPPTEHIYHKSARILSS